MRKVYVVRSSVEHNAETGANDPVFTLVDVDGAEFRGTNVIFEGPASLRYSADQSYGRRVWIETFGKVTLSDGFVTSIFSPLVDV